MGQALYRKYRSQSLAEIVGQEHITRALSRALEQDKLSHAYLFTGPRGTGKTSIARILAFEANELPYDETASHLDIIEIDAASNRRIDEIRDLREKVHIAPTSAKYKVYIIDEVHMLTREAFNALLKTLEEPPAHVIFILATTEMHKLPDTIVSRTQHYAFKPIELTKVTSHLSNIAKKEKFTIDEDALELIAAHGEGSFRDSISLLDQIRNYADKITLQDVQSILGVAPDTAIANLIDLLSAHDAAKTVALLNDLRGQGIEPNMLARQLGQALRAQLLQNSSALGSTETLTLLKKLIEIPSSTDPFTALELCLLDTAFAGHQNAPQQVQPTSQIMQPITQPEPQQPKAIVSEPVIAPKTIVKPLSAPAKAKAQPQTEETPINQEPAPKTAPGTSFNPDQWPEVLNVLKAKYNTMYGVLRMANPVFAGDVITLQFKFAFHQKRLNDPKNKKIIIDAVMSVSGVPVNLVCEIAEVAPATSPSGTPQSTDTSDSLGSISNIFGGGELLES